MTDYEALSLGVSVVAMAIAVFVWFGQRKLQREANELQKATAELASKQLEVLRKEQQATLRLELRRDTKGTVRFVLTNVSGVKATDVDMKLLVDDDPIFEQEYSEKLPVKALGPGSSISLIASLTLGRPTSYNAMVSWTNPDGSRVDDEQFVTF